MERYPGMVGVRIREKQAKRLAKLAPEYLRGPRNLSKCVQWAIDQFVGQQTQRTPNGGETNITAA